MGLFDFLFPVQDDKSRQEWKEHLTTNTAVGPGLAEWRSGMPPSVRLYEICKVERYPTPTLHPGHKQYSSIESAKLKRESAYEQAAIKERYNRKFTTGYTRDGREFPILRINPPELPYGRPSIRQFYKPLRLRLPKEFE